MSTENTSVETDDINLDDFSADFFGQKEAEPDKTNSESIEEDEQESDANEDTHDSDEGDEADVAERDEDDGEDEAEPKAEPKKNRFQERIDEVVGKQREAERKLEAALAEINNLKQNVEPKPAPVKVAEVNGPLPDDLNEDGIEKYPLGEFDPGYIKDLMKHTLDVEEALRADVRKAEEADRVAQTQKAELQSNWDAKLAPAQERYPDFQEKGEELIGAFSGIDEAYGNYLTQTLMSMEHGPDVLYYLANNLDEATKIIQSGAQKATIALGHLEAKFIYADEEKQKARPKVSKAAEPPKQLNRGSSVVISVPDDTDDLDAFSAKLFKKK